MKKKITQLLVLAMVFSATTFATNVHDNVNKYIQNVFSQKFTGAKEVTWSTTETYVKATFQLDGQFMGAYYTKSGDLMGVARNLLSYQLPFNLQSGLKKQLNGAWIVELFEYSTEDETSYYATIENANQRFVIKSIESRDWIVVKKVKKD